MSKLLSDNDFFELFCKSVDVLYNQGFNLVVFVKDNDSEYRYLSKLAVEELQGREGSHIPVDYILGKDSKNDSDRTLQKYLEEAKKQDEMVKSLGRRCFFLHIDVSNQLYFLEKRPIVNPASNNIVGILGYARPFVLPSVIKMIYEFHGIKLDVINESSDESHRQAKPRLTEKQHMVLFFYINKYSNTEIATVLSKLGYQISSGRVNEHLAKIKYLFGVRSKEALVDVAIKLNYHLFIPRKLLKTGTYLLDDELIICES